jgi:dynein heavy chain 2, cytosolic
LSVDRIKEELKDERGTLVTQLMDQFKRMEKDFESKTESSSVDKPPLSNNMSRSVSDIVWAR